MTTLKNSFLANLFLIVLLFSSLANSQTKDIIYLWPNEVPGEKKAKHPPRQTDNRSGNVIRLTDITNPTLTVFKPEKRNDSDVGIIVCPGGGYQYLTVNKEGYEIAEWLNTLGYTAFVLEYRVPEKQEGALNDIQRAIRIVRGHSKKYNINPDKIGVLGFSAGGSLAARASTRFTTDSYSKIDDLDNLSSRPDFSILIYPAYLDKGENRSLTPELTITDKTPPFFIFETADDPYGNSALVMTTALRDHKIPVELHFLPEGGHGYGMRPGNIAAETWPSLAKNWLHSMFKPKLGRTQNFPKEVVSAHPVSKKKKTWVFLLAGQSNMAGRGFVEPQDTIPSNRIFTINKQNEVVLAKEPLHFYEPNLTGLDCGLSFGKKLLEHVPDDVSIVLIPTAVGGSPINKWINDSVHRDVQLLTNFKQKVEIGKGIGQIKGVLWHQGESDTGNSNGYQEKLGELFSKFRTITEDKRLPILIAELGSYSTDNESWQNINTQIKQYTLTDKHTFLIKTTDLKDKGDKIHFNAEGQRLIGERFAIEYITYYKK
ncbi:alpha/beta hydrolase fold domain-containing protein [Flaviramulus sp. BrNp1-15]|uniref:sialate O-acetylesterase n=1 Tax=Flaviramulus sp. BrNp1-15 TaxID=2916754 RepID=UPI001EE99AFA|nr:sialate O-acetylesterase [Flaviramulus sp. BrNp1-15]ULC58558.1 alpha/beta hydrolase fold domain-containing protein [Flaviramulus sp. BrNp1-15]